MRTTLRTIVLCALTLSIGSGALYAGSSNPSPPPPPPPPPPSSGPSNGGAYGGYLSLAAVGNFFYTLATQGVTTTFPSSVTTSDQHLVSPVQNGFLVLNSGRGEIQAVGGMTFTRGSSVIALKRIAFESTPNGIFLTASLIVNGVYQNRSPVFLINAANPFTSQLALGQVSSGDLTFTVDPTFASTLTNYFQITPVPTGSVVGSISFTTTLINEE